ncbi:proton gradient regulation [Tribonema minus]|uniref:Proton gradient regulation n=1 Tax=Tribonema minus TaxID=303371 RepID=A0A836CLY1_9STRA|nr:proton gradient regulation [Tribonema minus]
MKGVIALVCLAAAAVSSVSAFVMPAVSQSSFVARTHTYRQAAPAAAAPGAGVRTLHMGKVSKFGLFSPAVIAAKVVLGEARLNKIRGKAIALHSQTITSFCDWVGADSKMRGLLIKKAKTTGDELGFLW